MKKEKTFHGLLHGLGASLREKMPASFNEEWDKLLGWLRGLHAFLHENAQNWKPPQWVDKFDNWCDDRLWVLQAFLRGRLLCQAAYIPVDNRFYLPVRVPIRRIVMLMKWWEISDEEIKRYVREMTQRNTGSRRMGFATVLALMGAITQGHVFVGTEDALTLVLRTRLDAAPEPMPEIRMPIRGSFGEQCSGAPIPPHIRRKEERDQKFAQRQKIPGRTKQSW